MKYLEKSNSEAESRMVVARGWRWKEQGVSVYGYRAAVLQGKKKFWSFGWLHSNVMYIMPGNCTFQSDEQGRFYAIQHKKDS